MTSNDYQLVDKRDGDVVINHDISLDWANISSFPQGGTKIFMGVLRENSGKLLKARGKFGNLG